MRSKPRMALALTCTRRMATARSHPARYCSTDLSLNQTLNLVGGWFMRSATRSPSVRSMTSEMSTSNSSTRGSIGHAGSGVDLTRLCNAVFGVTPRKIRSAVAKGASSSRQRCRSSTQAAHTVLGLEVMAEPSDVRPAQCLPERHRGSVVSPALGQNVLAVD